MFKPTESQQTVLDAKSKNIVVSASAGSGKTTLMIEKVVKIIEDEKADISKFLICTFTKSAGEEMKSRLYEKLEQKLNEETDINKRKIYTTAYDKIELAKICTIDKFCLDIVKKYFYRLGIDPNIENLSSFDENFLKNRAFMHTLEKFESENSEIIDLLCMCFLEHRDLKKLKQLVYKIYSDMQTRPDAIEYFDKNAFKLYNETAIIQLVEQKLNMFELNAKLLIEEYTNVLKFLNPERDEENIKRLNSDIKLLNSYFNLDTQNKIKYIFNLDINGRFKASEEFDFKELTDIKNNFNSVKNDIVSYFDVSDLNEIIARCLSTRDIIEKLKEFVLTFANCYLELKMGINQFEFNDIQHFALDLLKKDDIRDDIVKDIDYIFVDEFQDVNYLQDELIHKLARNDNVFLVGDAKQSIYGFRLCTPEILIKTMDKFESDGTSLAQNLNENFRSDKVILDFINEIFNKIMTIESSGIDYEGKAQLKGALSYNNELLFNKVKVDIFLDSSAETNSEDEKAEKVVYDITKSGDDDISKVDREASHIANLVIKCLEEKIFDTKRNQIRNVNFGDIAILFRKRKALYKAVVEKLSALNVPLTIGYKEDIFDSFEVRFVNALLSLIMNFDDDIALTTALTFPSIGVTDDELALIRLKSLDADTFSSAVKNFAISCNCESDADCILINKKIKKLLMIIDLLKNQMYTSTVYDLIKQIENSCDLTNILYSINNPKIIANYAKFISEIKSSKFVNLIDYLQYIEERENDDSDVNVSGGENSVKCLTIHESKGLEFPIVICAGAGEKRNSRTDDILIHNEGIACDYFNIDGKWKASTIIKNYINEKLKHNETEELKRLLYVALTRAKNQLFVVGTITSKQLKTPYYNYKEPNFMQYILSELKPFEIETLESGGGYKNESFEFNICNDEVVLMQNSNSEDVYLYTDKELNEIYNYISYEYPNKENFKIAFKNTVSAILKAENNGEHYNIEPRKLEIGESALKSNELGTLYHKVLESIDFKKDYTDDDISTIIKANESSEGVVSIAEIKNAINTIKRFIGSDDVIFKEQPFIFKAKHKDIVTSNCEEEILVQGVIDLIIKKPNGEIVIIDYKNTNIKDDNVLRDKYKKQLELYKYATKLVEKTDKISTYLYSIKQNKIIEV